MLRPLLFGVLGTCLGTSATPVEESLLGLQDGSLLVQSGVRAHQQAASSSAASAGRSQTLAAAAAGQLPQASMPKFDCGKYPYMCKAPFNCDTYGASDMQQSLISGIAGVGKANFRHWCLFPSHGKYVETCVVQKDPVKAAWLQYNWSVAQANGADELDASYCFIEGHCSNAAVDNETKLEDTFKMCDERVGHDDWTKLGSIPAIPKSAEILQSWPQDFSEGFHDPRVPRLFTLAACSMGIYHCDINYCKETYCQNPYYVRKYGHLLPRVPGHLIQNLRYVE